MKQFCLRAFSICRDLQHLTFLWILVPLVAGRKLCQDLLFLELVYLVGEFWFFSCCDILHGPFRPPLGRLRLIGSMLPGILVTTELFSNVFNIFSQTVEAS